MKVFELGGITYHCDDSSVGLTGNGWSTSQGAIRRIREKGLKGLNVLDICCGVGIIGLTMLKELGPEIIRNLILSDINIFNLNSITRTIKANNIDHSNIQLRLSDGLKNMGTWHDFNLIVSNPPHCYTESYQDLDFSASWLGTVDEQWKFHIGFYSECDSYLVNSGEIWFLENKSSQVEEVALSVIKNNSYLEYIGKEEEPLDQDFYWMLTKRV